LVQEVLGVSQAAAGVSSDEMQGGGFGFYAFGGAYLLQPLNDGRRRDVPEVEPLATGYDGAWKTLGLCGGQDEYDVRGRLLKGFE
jgi:hypothetical protein